MGLRGTSFLPMKCEGGEDDLTVYITCKRFQVNYVDKPKINSTSLYNVSIILSYNTMSMFVVSFFCFVGYSVPGCLFVFVTLSITAVVRFESR